MGNLVPPSISAMLREKRAPSTALIWSIAIYVFGMSVLIVKRWFDWRYGFDNGIFQQSMSLLVRGNIRGIWYASHWSPVLAFLAPLFALCPNGLTLQLAQAALLGATALPAFLVARKYLVRGASIFAAFVLFYPPVLAFAYNDMHEAAFFPLLVWSMLWAIDGEHYAWFAFFALAAANVREDASLGIAVFGFALGILALRKRTGTIADCGVFYGRFRRPRIVAACGFTLGVVSCAIAVTFLRVVDPYHGSSHLGGIYKYSFSDGSPFGLLLAISRNPHRIFEIFSFEKAMYLPRLLLPLAGLPLASPWSALALPQLTMILLSSNRDVWTPELQYVALMSPWLQLGALDAVRRIATRAPGAARGWLQASLYSTAAVLIFANPMHIGRYQRAAHARQDAIRALAVIPASQEVSLPIPWFVSVAAARPKAIPYFCTDVAWAVYADDDPEPLVRGEVARLENEIHSGTTIRAARFGHVSVFHRRPKPGPVRCSAEF